MSEELMEDAKYLASVLVSRASKLKNNLSLEDAINIEENSEIYVSDEGNSFDDKVVVETNCDKNATEIEAGEKEIKKENIVYIDKTRSNKVLVSLAEDEIEIKKMTTRNITIYGKDDEKKVLNAYDDDSTRIDLNNNVTIFHSFQSGELKESYNGDYIKIPFEIKNDEPKKINDSQLCKELKSVASTIRRNALKIAENKKRAYH